MDQDFTKYSAEVPSEKDLQASVVTIGYVMLLELFHLWCGIFRDMKFYRKTSAV